MTPPSDVQAALGRLESLARLEPWLWAAGTLLAVAVVVRRMRRPAGGDGPPPRRAAEAVTLAAIVAVGLVLRLVGLDHPQQPRFYFSESTVEVAQRILDGDGIAAATRPLWLQTAVVWAQESPILLPVHAVVQRAVGATVWVPGIVGALWATLATLLAWAVGRALVSPAFGLAFAAFLTVAPLQIAWSRLGGLQIPAVTHTLLVIGMGFAAGKRRSVVLALLTGVLAFTSLYHYYPARIAPPLGVLAMSIGLARGAGRGVRAFLCLPVAIGATVAVGLLVARSSNVDLWPRYTGYVGSKGESSIAAAIANAQENIAREAPRTVERYFWALRAMDPVAYWGRGPWTTGAVTSFGVQYGGLVLLPIGLLGGVGLLVCLRHPWRNAIWLALAAGGLLLPLLSVPTARRMLLFDLAWCAFAAHGLCAVARAVGRPGPVAWTLVVLVALGAWSGGTLALLAHTLPMATRVTIPFGESGFGDGYTCLQCVADGERWRADIAGGAFVVLFDPDMERENATSPAGLRLYGRIAARTAKRPGTFVELYSLLQNVDRDTDPPRVERPYPIGTSAIDELRKRLDAAGAGPIVWEFRHPNVWETALADRLVAAGGIRTALADVPPILTHPYARVAGVEIPAFRVTTPPDRRRAALTALRAFLDPPTSWSDCLAVAYGGMRTIDNDVLGVFGVPGAGPTTNPARWALGSYRFAFIGPLRVEGLEDPTALRVDADTADIRLLDRNATEVILRADGERSRTMLPNAMPIGRGCAAAAGGRWFIVDALAGTVRSTPPAPFAIPTGRWLGVTSAGDRLVLAGPDELVVLDATTGAVRARFPARVSAPWPHRRGDCTPIAASDEWIVLLDPYGARVAFHAWGGKALADVRLADHVRPVALFGFTAIGAARATVGVGQANRLDLLTATSICPQVDPAPGS